MIYNLFNLLVNKMLEWMIYAPQYQLYDAMLICLLLIILIIKLPIRRQKKWRSVDVPTVIITPDVSMEMASAHPDAKNNSINAKANETIPQNDGIENDSSTTATYAESAESPLLV